MSSNFDFSVPDDDSSISNSTSNDDDTRFSFSEDPTVSTNLIEVTLSDDEMEYIEGLARKRNQSYKQGQTTDTTVGGSDGLDVHISGLKGELAVSKVYGDGTVDESISASGDDGVDVTVTIGDEEYNVDVKTNSYSTDAWILLKKGHASWNADCYVSSFVPDNSNKVIITGWATAEELIQESNIEQSKYGWKNYKLTSDEQENPVKPDTEIVNKDWCQLR